MGLFDFFRDTSSRSEKDDGENTSSPVDANEYLVNMLQRKLSDLGYPVERHPQYHALVVNSEIEIATAIIDNPDYHRSILHLMVVTIHQDYFPNGIEENIVGVGDTLERKIHSVLDNYIDTTFLPILESFTDRHNPELDFTSTVGGREVLWHPKLGNLTVQGQWNEQPKNEPFFELLKDTLPNKLGTNKLSWLKLYISKRSDGTIIGECLFNNEPWDEGLSCIAGYASSWRLGGDFQGMKQFIMFRRCDAFDS